MDSALSTASSSQVLPSSSVSSGPWCCTLGKPPLSSWQSWTSSAPPATGSAPRTFSWRGTRSRAGRSGSWDVPRHRRLHPQRTGPSSGRRPGSSPRCPCSTRSIRPLDPDCGLSVGRESSTSNSDLGADQRAIRPALVPGDEPSQRGLRLDPLRSEIHSGTRTPVASTPCRASRSARPRMGGSVPVATTVRQRVQHHAEPDRRRTRHLPPARRVRNHRSGQSTIVVSALPRQRHRQIEDPRSAAPSESASRTPHRPRRIGRRHQRMLPVVHGIGQHSQSISRNPLQRRRGRGCTRAPRRRSATRPCNDNGRRGRPATSFKGMSSSARNLDG